MDHPRNPRAGRKRALVLVLAASAVAAGRGETARTPVPSPAEVALRAAELPLRFERNEGQADRAVRWLARCRGFTFFLADDGAVLSAGGARVADVPDSRGAMPRRRPVAGPQGVLRLGFLGAAPAPRFESLGLLGSVSNYFLGKDPARWRPRVGNHSGVAARGLWPGVDLEFRGDPARLEYALRGAPGADPARARFSLGGAESARVDGGGDLVLSLAAGEMRMSAPVAWQDAADGTRRAVAAAFRLGEDGTLGFSLGRLDPSLPWTVDPRVDFATYLGGGVEDWPSDVAVDGSGRVVVGGYTSSTNFPTQTPYQGALSAGFDAFVTVYGAALGSVAFSTYLGGTGNDFCEGVCVDGSGNIAVVGDTASTDYPTSSPYQGTNKLGAVDMFVTKISSTGTSLVFSTFVGSSANDQAEECFEDSTGLYVIGGTGGTDFPVVNPVQSTFAGGAWDVALLRLASDGSALTFSTYYGGTLTDYPFGLAVDGNGGVIVGGNTTSTDFPTVAPIQGTHGGGPSTFPGDTFLLKLPSTLSGVSYATFLGGSGFDDCTKVAVDGNGDVFLAGVTSSTNYPVASPIQATFAGGASDGWLTKVNSAGSAILLATYFGGNANEYTEGLAVGSGGTVTFAGFTSSSNFPTLNAFQSTFMGGTPVNNDAWIAQVSGDGGTLLYSSYLASNGGDDIHGLALDANGAALVVGVTNSTTFPTQSPIQTTNAGGTFDGYVARVVKAPPAAPTGLTATAQGSSQVQLAWTDASDNETLFEIERRTGADPFAKIAQANPNAQGHVDFTVAPGTTYDYRVRAVNPDGASAYTNEAQATTAIVVPPPAVPGDFVAFVSGPGTVDLTWTDRSTNEISFELQRRAGSGAYIVAASLPPGSTAFTNSGLSPDVIYTYRLRAVGQTAVSGFTPETSALTDPTFTLLATKGVVADSANLARDRVKVAGTVTFLPGSPDGVFNPLAELVTVQLVSDVAPITFTIPAGDPGWKVRKTKYRWKSPTDALTKLTLVIDTGRGTVKIAVVKLDLPQPPANPIRVSLRAGSDAGSHRTDWTLKKPGLYKYP